MSGKKLKAQSTQHKASSKKYGIQSTRRGSRSGNWLAAVVLWTVAVANFTQGVFADAITFAGSSIALRDCRVEGLRGGKVHYTDARGQRQQRAIEEVRAIAFDDLPALEVAEQSLGETNHADGLVPLLRALLQGETELHRQWVRCRLVRFHEARGETVEAISHAAVIMGGSDDPSWKSIEPTGALNDASFAAVKEAHENLQIAARKNGHAELRAVLDRLSKKIQPLHDRLVAEHPSEPAALGGTLSGIAVQSIKDGQAGANPAVTAPETTAAPPPPVRSNPRAATPARAASPSKALESPTTDAASPQAIDSLLEKARNADALARCESVRIDPGDRDLAHFLHQYGLALSRNGKADDAAVMFTRCAALYPFSEDACQSLIQLSILHRDAWADLEAAQRLLRMAHARAQEYQHTAAATLAVELMPSVGAR